MFRAQDDKVQNQQLKVQELVVRTADTQLYVTDSGDVIVKIGQPVSEVVQCLFQDDSAVTITPIAAVSLAVVESDSPYGDDADGHAIRVEGVTLAASDLLVVKYIAQD